MLSIIIPAYNEADYIGDSLDALIVQAGDGLDDVEIIVAANGCTDLTVQVAEARADRVKARGWSLDVLDIPEGGKPNALNRGDAAASGDMRLYLDADTRPTPGLLAALVAVLARPEPAFASGQFAIAPARSWITRHYFRLWVQLPFMTRGVNGGGLYAVNAAGRARWGCYPELTADDLYARLQFSPTERHKVDIPYLTPMPEGLVRLVRVRRRWDAGVRELAEACPDLMINEDKPAVQLSDHARLLARNPISYSVYVCVSLIVRLRRHYPLQKWARGR